MSSFYLNDPLVLNELKLTNQDFRIYSYCCRQFNVVKVQSYIRLVNIAGQFQISLETVQQSISNLSRIHIDGLALIKVHDNGKYLVFDMPRHKHFIQSIGFQKYNQSRGWKALKEHTQGFIKKKYLFPNLDQHQLFVKLVDLPKDEFDQINENDLMFKWVYKDAKKYRTPTR